MSERIRVLVTGGQGQLGSSLKQLENSGQADDIEFVIVDRSEADIADRRALSKLIMDVRPRVVLNAAAYTAVDSAETDSDTAMRVNGDAVKGLAEICLSEDVRLVQISTDFVFGVGHDTPIAVGAEPSPLSVYGHSKLVGERACLDILGENGLVVRTSWLYANGHPNFVNTMIRLMQTRNEIGVVDDQTGSPTACLVLAERLLCLIRKRARGVLHLTDAGQATWYEFAIAIRELASRHGLIDGKCEVRPITTRDYPTPAARPSYSVLDNSESVRLIGKSAPHWRSNLERLMADWTDPGAVQG